MIENNNWAWILLKNRLCCRIHRMKQLHKGDELTLAWYQGSFEIRIQAKQIKILTEFKVSFIVRKMISFLIIWMIVNLQDIQPPTYPQPWCPIALAIPIIDQEIATILRGPNLWIKSTKLTINSPSLSNYTLISKKMKKSIIHIQLKNKSYSNRMLYPQLETKKLQMVKSRRSRLQDRQPSQFINRFQRLRSILRSGNSNKIWLPTFEA
jgi:hypothetical protein